MPLDVCLSTDKVFIKHKISELIAKLEKEGMSVQDKRLSFQIELLITILGTTDLDIALSRSWSYYKL